jgi:FkbM family methyltransferase
MFQEAFNLIKSDAFRLSPGLISFRLLQLWQNEIFRKPQIIDIDCGNSHYFMKIYPDGPKMGSRGIFLFRQKYESLLEICDKLVRPGDVVLDCGANQGIYSCAFSSLVGKMGKVVAFEPISDLFVRLLENLDINGFGQCIPFRCGVYDDDCEMEIDLSAGIVAASVVREFGGKAKRIVKLRSIDNVISELNIGIVNFIKRDIEGAEPKAIRGARSVIERSRPIIAFEVGTEESFSLVYCELIDFGYEFFVPIKDGLHWALRLVANGIRHHSNVIAVYKDSMDRLQEFNVLFPFSGSTL